MSFADLDVDVVLAPNPSPMTGRGTNTYVLGHGDDVAVVDPGPGDEAHLRAIEILVAARGRAAMVVLTHHHPDHAEAGPAAARRLNAPLAAIPHPLAPPIDRPLAPGLLDLGRLHLRVLPTPGHSRDHLCLLWDEERAVLAGDLVAGEGFIVIDPPDGDMNDYLASLRQVRRPDLFGERGGARVLLPGHGPAIEEPAAFLSGYIAHRLARERMVLESLSRETPQDLDQTLPMAYHDTPEFMLPIAARSLLAHLEKLVGDGLVEYSAAGYRRLG